MDAWAERVVARLAVALSLGDEERAITAYGLKLLLSNSLYLLAIIAVGAATGLLPECLGVALTLACFRLSAGGAHLRTPSRCALASALLIAALAGAARALRALLISPPAWWVAAACLVLLGVLALGRYAPAAVPERPIGPEEAKLLRRRALGTAAVWAAVVGAAGPLLFDRGWIYASALGYSWQLLSVTPLGFRIAGLIDRAFDALRPARGAAG